LDAWVFGPLVLQKDILLTAIAIITGFSLMKLRLRGYDAGGKSYDRPYDALLVWLLIWKLSILLTDFQSVRDSLLTLLYFSGGERGAWIAVAAVCGYVWLKDHKSPDWPRYRDSWLFSILGGYTIYRLLELCFVQGNTATEALLVVLGIATLGLWMKGQSGAQRRTGQQLFLAFVLGHALISAVAGSTWDKTGFGGETVNAEGIATGIRVGERAPDFTLQGLEGETVKLSDFRGKKVFVNFWATWCPPCQVEMPHMQRFYSEYKERDAVILSVNATQTEASKVVVKAFASHWELTFPIVLDTEGEVGKMYKVAAYPVTYLIDEQGVIRKKVQGPMNEEALKKAVR
jgi:peroxiredoxin